MMKKKRYLLLCFLLITAGAFCAVIQQNNFTSGENNTLPSNLTASYDPGVDVNVVTIATMSPTPPVDHTGGDGYVLRVGDLGSAGGGFDWAYPEPVNSQTNCKISVWVYVNWSTWDATPLERDYLLMLRLAAQNPQTAPARNGYLFLITANSSWDLGLINPTNYRPFIMKRVGSTAPSYTILGTYGPSDVTTGWHKLAFQAVGSELRGYVDDVLVCAATDTQYTSGSCAFGYYEDNGSATAYPYAAAYDNFLFETPDFTSVENWNLY